MDEQSVINELNKFKLMYQGVVKVADNMQVYLDTKKAYSQLQKDEKGLKVSICELGQERDALAVKCKKDSETAISVTAGVKEKAAVRQSQIQSELESHEQSLNFKKRSMENDYAMREKELKGKISGLEETVAALEEKLKTLREIVKSVVV